MCFKKFLLPLAFLSLVLSLPTQCLAMGGKPQEKRGPTTADIDKAPSSPLTLKELAHIYWPDSQATQLQQEEALKNLLGKKVSKNINRIFGNGSAASQEIINGLDFAYKSGTTAVQKSEKMLDFLYHYSRGLNT